MQLEKCTIPYTHHNQLHLLLTRLPTVKKLNNETEHPNIIILKRDPNIFFMVLEVLFFVDFAYNFHSIRYIQKVFKIRVHNKY